MDEFVNVRMQQLENHINSEDFLDIAYEVVDDLEDGEYSKYAIPLILQMMESHPNVDFGSPGPLVHYVESYYKNGYEQELIASIRRRPTTHTLWMLNRIVNGMDGQDKDQYLSLFDDVIVSSDVDPQVVEHSKMFKSLHV